MHQRLSLLLLFSLSLNTNAQIFYTDSKVSSNKVSFEAFASPMTMLRKVASDLQGNQVSVSDTWHAMLNTETGMVFTYNTRSLRFGVGVGQSDLRWGVSDSMGNRVNTHARYWTFPVRVGLVTQITDVFSLEVWPQLTIRKAISLEKNWLILPVAPRAETPLAAGLTVGSAFRMNDHFSFTLGAVMEFGLDDLEDAGSGPAFRTHGELPFFLGLRTGLRFSL